jgi:ATP adenylyltransferase
MTACRPVRDEGNFLHRSHDLLKRCGFSVARPSATLARMDFLWTPWRYAYVTGAHASPDCIFCDAVRRKDDEKTGIIFRAERSFIILNTFPYTSGHLMIVPYEHVDELRKLDAASAQEMMILAQRAEGALRELYRPDGINLGMNIGQAAGAGVAAHIHMHVLPRWAADTNFMTTISETRILPEALDVTYSRLKEKLG